MKTLIIYCHPHESSHNAKILKNITDTLDNKRKEYEVIDLYKNDFNTFFKHIEYDRMRKRERVTEPDVLAMQEKVMASKNIIFVYPVWWYNMPGKLKGFMDRVFTAGFAYRFKKVPKWQEFFANIISFIPGLRYLFQPFAANGQLKGKRAFIFRSYGGPPMGRRFFNNTVGALENVILRFSGITDITIHELYNCDKRVYTQAYEDQYMSQVKEYMAHL